MLRVCLLYLIPLSLTSAPAAAPKQFPEWRGSTTLLLGEWAASPIMAVGEVVNVATYGAQKVDHLPRPMSPTVHRLYWCEGDFRLTAVIKGELHLPPKKYLWASTFPGCRLWPNNPRFVFSRFQTRVWFLREEGDFLRPTYDSGASLFIGLFARWDDGQRAPARQRLGMLLLTPAANSDTLEDFATYLWDIVDIACELLGKAECVEKIEALAKSGNPAIHGAACGFLKGQLGVDCASGK
jgi:hypothetical protein